MKQDFDELHYFAGYPDRDSMREKAKRLMLEEMMGTAMTMPGSFSEPGREKMRLYKKGGHVKHHHKHKSHHSHHHDMHKIKGGLVHEPHSYEHEEIHPLHGHHSRHHHSKHEHDHSYERAPGYKKGGHHKHHENKEKKRAHLHKLQREGLHETERALKEESHLKHGGHMHHKKHHHHADGGRAHLFPMHYHEESGMKRTYNRHAPETHQRKLMHRDIEGGSLSRLHIPTPKLNVESIREAEMMHKGGHMHKSHHKKHHHHVRKATGGTVYEHEMRGEGKRGTINYEKDMKGVHPSHIPPMTGTKRKNPGALDQSGGKLYKKGGKACKKFAAGGAGKIRHGVADKLGRPITKKLKMGY